jgi:hypothetical protein
MEQMYVLAFEGADRSTGRRYVSVQGQCTRQRGGVAWRAVLCMAGCIYFFGANSPDIPLCLCCWAG